MLTSSMMMTSCPRMTGNSGFFRTVRFTVTFPMRISSVALLREQKPSFDMARASPVRVAAGGGGMAQD